MMNVMKRAWEIYRTLTGDHVAKLAMALKKAWAEAKTLVEVFRNDIKRATITLINPFTKAVAVEYYKATIESINKKVSHYNEIGTKVLSVEIKDRTYDQLTAEERRAVERAGMPKQPKVSLFGVMASGAIIAERTNF